MTKFVVMLCTVAPGGMAEVVNNLVRAGLTERYDVKLLATHDRGSALTRIGIFAAAFAHFLSLLLTFRVSLVHAHVAMRGSFWRKSIFLLLASLFRVPTILHLHGSEFKKFYEHQCGPLGKYLVRMVFRRVTYAVVLSGQWRDFVLSIVPQAHVVIVHNFVDAARCESERLSMGVDRSESEVLFLGEIGHRKGIYDLIKAIQDVAKQVPGVRLIAGGAGDIEGALSCAEELGIRKHISMPGWVSGLEKTELLARAAVYVLPSYNEGLPVSILEAMAARLPVISTPVGGIPEAIRDGQEGFLVSPGDTAMLSQRITELLQDRSLRSSMGENCWLRVNAVFSLDSAMGEIERLYRKSGV